jgi:short-subunit dehydrogenase
MGKAHLTPTAGEAIPLSRQSPFGSTVSNPLSVLQQAWRRRWWRADPTALAAYAELSPMVVVTGGSEGIGYELALRFALAGNDVMLVARRDAPLQEAARRIAAEARVKAIAQPADVATADAIPAIEAALAEHRAYCDVLVNSAGIGLAGPFRAHAPDDVLRMIDTNIRALSELTRHFLPAMRTRGRGGILNLASLGAYTPGPNQAAYYASKAYVLSLTEAIAAETAGEGVRVCALAPGPVSTAFHARMGAERAFYRAFVQPASARYVARVGYLGFVLGLRVTIPGLINPFLALAMRVMPHRILIPIVGWLLKPR